LLVSGGPAEQRSEGVATAARRPGAADGLQLRERRVDLADGQRRHLGGRDIQRGQRRPPGADPALAGDAGEECGGCGDLGRAGRGEQAGEGGGLGRARAGGGHRGGGIDHVGEQHQPIEPRSR